MAPLASVMQLTTSPSSLNTSAVTWEGEGEEGEEGGGGGGEGGGRGGGGGGGGGGEEEGRRRRRRGGGEEEEEEGRRGGGGGGGEGSMPPMQLTHPGSLRYLNILKSSVMSNQIAGTVTLMQVVFPEPLGPATATRGWGCSRACRWAVAIWKEGVGLSWCSRQQ